MPDNPEDQKKPVVNLAAIQSVEDYVTKSGKFREDCTSFEIPGRDAGGASNLYLPYCNKQRFDFGSTLNEHRGHGIFTPPEKGKRFDVIHFALLREYFHDIHCPNPCAGYSDRTAMSQLPPQVEVKPPATDQAFAPPSRVTRKEIVISVLVPLGLLLLGTLLAWVTPEGRRWLHLDKPPSPTSTNSSPPAFVQPAPSVKENLQNREPTKKPNATKVKVNQQNNTGVSGSILNNGGVVNNPVINNAPPPKPEAYELTDERRKLFLNALTSQSGNKDTLRVGCTTWSESSCVAAGRFLILLSQAGFPIEQNKVFRMEPLIPVDGVSIATRTATDEPKEPLPPHLGRWRLMDESHKSIYFAFQSLGITVAGATDDTLSPNTLGVYFGPEPK